MLIAAPTPPIEAAEADLGTLGNGRGEDTNDYF
jgi:hypothetical protein